MLLRKTPGLRRFRGRLRPVRSRRRLTRIEMAEAGITRPIMEITIAEEASLPGPHKTLVGRHPAAAIQLRHLSRSGSSSHRQKRRIRPKKSTARTRIKIKTKTSLKTNHLASQPNALRNGGVCHFSILQFCAGPRQANHWELKNMAQKIERPRGLAQPLLHNLRTRPPTEGVQDSICIRVRRLPT